MEEKNIQQEELNEEVIEETTEEIQNEEVDETTKLQDEYNSLQDAYQRTLAEYANYRRRTTEEKETIGVFANEKIITELIPVIDNMERAIEASTDKESVMYQGIEMVYKQLKDTLNKFGVEEIESEDKEFDPNLHMAVMQETVEGVEPNQVVMVLQKGYKLGVKVIRPAMVKVSC